ncbi:hypothetical protein [Caldilinea sp.]|uniref:hypothetical protein n=1 Tax=Caldilinea sp. TaxID=2293560 RepID=UPI001B13C3EB|nr:hypothetical protein [Caldilinea sp.]MBO9394933.1 hypothetical protein [Caldilinea sp.]
MMANQSTVSQTMRCLPHACQRPNQPRCEQHGQQWVVDGTIRQVVARVAVTVDKKGACHAQSVLGQTLRWRSRRSGALRCKNRDVARACAEQLRLPPERPQQRRSRQQGNSEHQPEAGKPASI